MGVQGLILPAILSFSTPTVLVLIAMTVWLTVLAGYWSLGRNNRREVEGGHCGDNESTQPLMLEGQTPASYNLGQYPQYYPPHQPSTSGGHHHHFQGPSAPPQMTPPDKNNPNLSPTLPVT